LDCLHYFPHLTYSQCWMAELSANFWPQGFVRVSFKQSEILHFFLSFNLVWMSKNILLSVCLFICKTKLKTLTEWTVSIPEGGIAITPVANTEFSFPGWRHFL
jgi:hypothetical protein